MSMVPPYTRVHLALDRVVLSYILSGKNVLGSGPTPSKPVLPKGQLYIYIMIQVKICKWVL